ncbi:hypothetical protein BDY17DRAFT_289363 [Neohortaea acidophila]|uniref:Uncharacterized protein n=1 Tax=Neohortaea acidophila TaxID=245834 RepID=A0A6A6Q6F3_9PEZI|nr:uncharacterized protein BDY17DRAFT_289363 [Neohortaea acidophila]KAF2487651.1 hypothetical protein BDY17DRAFT_289363 [Neohortaea acidophila]
MALRQSKDESHTLPARQSKMDSPSAQLVEPSMIEFDMPPSSPFVAEVDNRRSSPNKQLYAESPQHEVDTATMGSHTPVQFNMEDEKENVLEHDSTLAKMFASPNKHAAPDRSPSRADNFKSSRDSTLMPPPPPSARKVSVSPTKTPLRTSRSEAPTPRTSSRAENAERTPSQNIANFQAALDVRNAMMPATDNMYTDDTCYSTFSEIPDMTLFARLGQQSPTRRSEATRTPRADSGPTPRTSRKRSSTSRSPSPTPRRQKTPATVSKRADETGSFLIDFTQQLEGVTTNFQPTSSSRSQTESNLLQHINNQRSPNKSSSSRSHQTSTPNKNLLNLLDFELPPAPTPRSVPTITVRELESLKSSYLSQISSLKATLSGREAEVDSLKKAVGDAERRVGEAQESLREEKSKREHLEEEIESWKKRGVEFESVLQTVKEEVLNSEAEKEETNRKLEESERRADDAESRAVRAEERFADALAARMSASADGENATEDQIQRLVNAQIDAKIEAVSRELHSVYKEKHERKVATLKKSYEARSEKKTAELQTRVAELERANEDLQASKDSTFTGPISNTSTSTSTTEASLGEENSKLKSQLEAQNAAIARLECEMSASKQQQDDLQRELKQERIEKGELVAAVDEMLALQMSELPPPATPQGMRAMSVVEDFRKSISRPSLGLPTPSGLRVPGAGGSGIPGSARGNGGSLVSACPSSTAAGKSRMLANIERMGRTGSTHGAE